MGGIVLENRIVSQELMDMELRKRRKWNMKLEYCRKGEYRFPNLIIVQKEIVIGKYGMLRKSFLREHRSGWYQSMLLTGKLDCHLQDVQKTAEERMEVLMERLLQSYPVPDKEEDQLAWVAHINMIMAMAEKVVLNELIYK
jgi:hypothetical protein